MTESLQLSAVQFVELVDAAGTCASQGQRDLAAKLRRQINTVGLTKEQFHELVDAAEANQLAAREAAEAEEAKADAERSTNATLATLDLLHHEGAVATDQYNAAIQTAAASGASEEPPEVPRQGAGETGEAPSVASSGRRRQKAERNTEQPTGDSNSGTDH